MSEDPKHITTTKTKLVVVVIGVFVAGILGGMLIEHIIHGLQANSEAHSHGD